VQQVELPSESLHLHRVAPTAWGLLGSVVAFVVESQPDTGVAFAVVCVVASQPWVVVAPVAEPYVESQVPEPAWESPAFWPGISEVFLHHVAVEFQHQVACLIR